MKRPICDYGEVRQFSGERRKAGASAERGLPRFKLGGVNVVQREGAQTPKQHGGVFQTGLPAMSDVVHFSLRDANAERGPDANALTDSYNDLLQ